MIKKITLGLTALLSTFSASSLASQNNSSVDVNVPSYSGGFTFGLAGLYLRPSTDALDYGLVFPNTTATGNEVDPSQLHHGFVKSVEPDYDWGYRINVGYFLPGTGNDVSLTYTHFNQEETSSYNLGKHDVFLGTTTPLTFIASDDKILGSDAKAQFKYQALDLDFGQHINVGCNTHLRFLGGLRFADLDARFDANYHGKIESNVDPVTSETLAINTTQTSEFKGVGPRFGIDSEYSLGGGFSVVGQATSALLIGDFKTHFNEHDIAKKDAKTVSDYEISFSTGKQTRVVPNLTAKLGMAYNYQFCNPSRTKLTVEAGYQVDHFFNTIDRLSAEEIVGDRASKQTMDSSFDGPYVGIQVHV